MTILKSNAAFNSFTPDMEKGIYYKVNDDIVIDDPIHWILKRDKEIKERVAWPWLATLYENATKISKEEVVRLGINNDMITLLDNTKEKILEWSRTTLHPKMTESRFIHKIQNSVNLDKDKILHALEIAKTVHKEHKRKEGSPYIWHCIAVAMKALEENGDTDDIIIALLHDAYEDYGDDRDVFLDSIETKFWKNVSESIKKLSKYRGVTKISNEQYIKELSTDIKTLKIKWFDRIHNIECLRFTDTENRRNYLEETKQVYIPLFETQHKKLAEKMRRIIDLYKNNDLELEKWEKEIIKNF